MLDEGGDEHRLVASHYFRDLGTDGEYRVQECRRGLKDNGDIAQPRFSHLLLLHAQKVGSVEHHFAANYLCVWREPPHYGDGGDRRSAAAFHHTTDELC